MPTILFDREEGPREPTRREWLLVLLAMCSRYRGGAGVTQLCAAHYLARYHGHDLPDALHYGKCVPSPTGPRYSGIVDDLEILEDDGLIARNGAGILTVTPAGRAIVRKMRGVTDRLAPTARAASSIGWREQLPPEVFR